MLLVSGSKAILPAVNLVLAPTPMMQVAGFTANGPGESKSGSTRHSPPESPVHKCRTGALVAGLIAVPVRICTPYGKVSPTTMVVFVVVAVVWPAAPLTASSEKITRINIELQGARPSNRTLNGIISGVVVARVKLLITLGTTFPPEGFIRRKNTSTDHCVEGRRKRRWSAKAVCGVEFVQK